jgi:hypothetical protein
MQFTPLCIPELGAAVIHLTRGYHCLVDVADWPEMSKYNWNALVHKSGDPSYTYARRSIGVNGKNVKVMMHRQLMDAPPGSEVDHRNHRGLDNRRSNLLVTTRRGNAQNQRKVKGRYSKYRGVSYFKKGGKWSASMKINGKMIHIGVYANEEDAARARDAEVAKHYENPVLNFQS